MGHWHHDFADHRHHFDKTVTFDQFDTTTFVHADFEGDASFTARFILQVNGFELNGAPVILPGFGSHYGMYFLIDATGQSPPGGVETFNSMNVALLVDPQNNDGKLSASAEGIGFANGTEDDVALMTGTLSTVKQSGFEVDPPVVHPSFFQDIALTEAGDKVFPNDLDPAAILHEFLTTPGGPNNVVGSGGNLVAQFVNGTGAADLPATGIVTLDPKTSLSIASGLLNHEPHGGGAFCIPQC